MASFFLLENIFLALIISKIQVLSMDLINPGMATTNTCRDDCNIICNVEDGCSNSLFYITNNVPIFVNCTSVSACQDAVFYYSGTDEATQICYGKGACYNAVVYAFSSMNLQCVEDAPRTTTSYRSCRSTSVIDLVLFGLVTVTVKEDAAYGMSIYSFYHRGPQVDCINSCDLSGDNYIYYGLKFDEYCLASDSSCILAQSLISDTIYGDYIILNSLSGDYGTTYDFRSYSFDTNVLLPLVDRENQYTSFYPPTLTDSSLFLSVLCVVCGEVDVDLSTVNNAIITGGRVYSSIRSIITGSMNTFMLNSLTTLGVYSSIIHLNNFENVAVTFNGFRESSVYLGNNLDVNVNCGSTNRGSSRCSDINLYSTVNPYSAFPAPNWNIQCDERCESNNFYVHFSSVPIICQYINSGVSDGCNFLLLTASPTNPTQQPTQAPTSNPTLSPSNAPNTEPTQAPSSSPSSAPSSSPSHPPTSLPTSNPTLPTQSPSLNPSLRPTFNPTTSPTSYPTAYPTMNPTTDSTLNPTTDPTLNPTSYPTLTPTFNPTLTSALNSTSEFIWLMIAVFFVVVLAMLYNCISLLRHNARNILKQHVHEPVAMINENMNCHVISNLNNNDMPCNMNNVSVDAGDVNLVMTHTGNPRRGTNPLIGGYNDRINIGAARAVESLFIQNQESQLAKIVPQPSIMIKDESTDSGNSDDMYIGGNMDDLNEPKNGDLQHDHHLETKKSPDSVSEQEEKTRGDFYYDDHYDVIRKQELIHSD